MYKKIKFVTLLTFASLLIVACEKDDVTPTCSDGIMNGTETGVDCGGSCEPCAEPSELQGDILEDRTLDASIQYSLTGALVVKSPATLTIPAGTVIRASGGTSAYIGVEQGAKINVNGTATSPVVMTSGASNPQQGDWGGLVIAGKAPTNKGATPTTEVGDLSYGGTTSDDNSGSIRYLRVEYTGATFTNEKEFNGVSLFGVGSGTTFEYVQAYEAGDDGIEFFGGTVSGNNLIVTNSGDDGIDFADGWNGNGTNWYISGAAKGAIEGSNNGDDGDATPTTTTTLKNITVVGPVSEGALYYKEGGGKFTIDNFYAYNVNLGVKWKSSDTPAVTRATNGDLTITNMQFANNADGFEYSSAGAAKPTWLGTGIATGAGNKANAPEWAAGWSKGLSNSQLSKESLSGSISNELTLDAGVEYQLTSGFVVQDGGTLNIPAGTIIKATGGTSSYIAVAQGGKINVNGTPNNPVVMTSGSSTPEAGDWGGLVIAGKAPTNKGATPTTEVGDLSYGGTTSDDNSGSIRYLRVEYTGATFTNEKEFNGVSLFGVGSGTTFEYVQAYEAGDDGIEFFGGTVSGNNLVVTNSYDDGIDFADGWNGNGTNWYISGAAKGAIEGSNNGDNGNATPTTTTTLTNITVVGPVSEGALYYKEGGGKFTIDNFYAYNVNLGVKWKSSDTPAVTRATNGDLTITNMQFANNADGFEYSSAGATKPTWLGTGIATGAGNGSGAPDWTAGWTAGLSNSEVSSTENLEGEISSEITLNAEKEYLLTSGFVVKDGGTLNIPAGTIIKATGGTSSYIAVAQGGKINVNGTATSPVVMTSGASTPLAGDWGGLVIAGKAPTNKGATPTTEVGDLSYGGTTSDDNSGSIRYLRVEYTGATFTNEKEFNGVSLFGVGSGTTFEYVQAYEAGDDGIEFFGGTVSGNNLVVTNSYDDGIDFADGWNGNGTNWYISGAAKGAIEGSNNGDNGNATPTTTTTLTNITVVGPVSEGALYYKEGGGKFTVDNMFVSGANLGVKWKTSDAPAVARVGNGDLTVDVKFADNVTGFIYNTGGDASTVPSWMTIDDTNTGAGNGAAKADWMNGWTR